jgi:hypothetical protein
MNHMGYSFAADDRSFALANAVDRCLARGARRPSVPDGGLNPERQEAGR